MKHYFWIFLLSLGVFGSVAAQEQDCKDHFLSLLDDKKNEAAIQSLEDCWESLIAQENWEVALDLVNTSLSELSVRAVPFDLEQWIARGYELIEGPLAANKAAKASFLFNVASLRIEQGQLDKGMQLLRQAEQLLETQAKEHPANKYASSWLSLQQRKAALLRRQGDFKGGLQALNAALAKLEQGKIEGENLKERKARLLNERGVNYRNQGKLDKAQEDFLASLAILKEVYEDPLNEVFAPTYNNLGIIYARLGLPEKALEYFKRTAAVDEASLGPNNRYVPGTYNNIANIYMDLNRLSEAELHIAKAFEVAQDFLPADHPNMIIYYGTLKSLALDMNRPEDGLEYAQKKYAISRKLKDKEPIRYFEGLWDLGAAFVSTEQYDSAVYYHQKWWDFTLEEYGPKALLTAKAARHFGETLINTGADAKRGLALVERSAEILEAFPENYFERWRTYYSLADNRSEAGQYQKSWEAGQKYLAHVFPDYQAQSPQSCYQPPAEETFAVREYLNALGVNMKNLYEWGKASDSLVYLQAAYCYGEELIRQLLTMRSSFEASADQRQLLALKTQEIYLHISICWELAQRLEAPSYLERAFQLAELNKSLGLLDATRQKDVAKATGLPDSLRIVEGQLRMELAELKKEAEDARMAGNMELEQARLAEMLPIREKVQAFQAFLQKNYSSYYQKQYSKGLVHVGSVQQELLDAETALVEYLMGEGALFRFYLTAEDLKVSRIELPEDFQSSFEVFRQSISADDYLISKPQEARATYTELAQRYYQLLLEEPLADSPRKRLLIVTDGILGHLPFETLLTEAVKDKELSWKAYPYLLKKHTVSYAYSAQLLLERLQQPLHLSTELVAFAAKYQANDLDTAVQRSPQQRNLRNILTDLPGARAEVVSLEKYYRGRFFSGVEATERQFRELKGPFGVIHLAMHGIMDAENPMASSLVFTETSDSVYDNFLYAYELSNLNIQANLAVLSACETGYGKFEKGEGIMSLARSFRYAGTPSLVMSLWQVNDQATASLMALLYEKLAGGLKKDEALREAKLNYIEQARGRAAHPFYWAGWSLLGDTRAVEIEEKGGLNWGYLAIGFALVGLIALLWWRRKPL